MALRCAEHVAEQDSVSERLRRWTRNPLGSARRGSNPLAAAFQSPPGGRARRGRARARLPRAAAHFSSTKHIAQEAHPLGPPALDFLHFESCARRGGPCLSRVLASELLPFSRQCVRAAKETDSKSIGLCPQGFESPRCRCPELSRRDREKRKGQARGC